MHEHTTWWACAEWVPGSTHFTALILRVFMLYMVTLKFACLLRLHGRLSNPILVPPFTCAQPPTYTLANSSTLGKQVGLSLVGQ